MVKVAENPTAPQTKDNWRFKHHVEYEKAFGPIPEGCDVVMANRDKRDFRPENLVAVPHRLMSRINSAAVGRRRIAPRVHRVVRARRARPFGGDGHAARVRRMRQDVHAAAERDAVRAPAEHEDVPRVPRGGEEEPRRIEAGRAPDLRGVRRAIHGASEVAAPLPEVHRGASGMHRRVPQEMARAAWDVSGWKE